MIGIYGSNGFIGRHLVRRLASQGRAIRAVSRRQDEHFCRDIGGTVDFVEADLNDSLAMAASLQDVDTVVQLVSTSSPGLRNEYVLEDLSENVIPHVGFLRCCVQAGVRRFMFLSSGGTVYGPEAPTPTGEEAETRPICSHGLTKLVVEKYIQMHAHVDGLDYVILRLANPFGPGQEFRKGQGLIPAVLDRYRKGLPVRIFGNGSAKRDYVYIDDVIDAVVAAVDSEAASRQVLNIASGQARSVAEVVDAIERIAGGTLLREYVDERKTDVDVSELDIRRAARILGWSPATPFEAGLERTIHETFRGG